MPIYTIAYGKRDGFVELDGKRQLVPVDHELMAEIAKLRRAVRPVRREVDRRRAQQGLQEHRLRQVGYEKAEREVTSRFAGYGLAFAVLAALGAITLGATWP